MNTGSRDEQRMLSNIERIARSLERIASVMEDKQFGITLPALEQVKAEVLAEAAGGSTK